MVDLGYYSLLFALAASVYCIASSCWGVRTRSDALVRSGENALYASSVTIYAATAALVTLLVTHDFRVEYVAGYSSRDLPMPYLVTALWGGQKGSLLLWTMILTTFAWIVVLQNRHKNRDLMPYVAATLSGVQVFFLGVMIFSTNPFETLPFTPPDGMGLNPLLQNPLMVIHPPQLYLGFIGFTVPFAFCVAALAARRVDADWIRISRRWTLVAWMFLTVGITLGAYWAYNELGWGGYWAWDPVENASFMPWLIATAFLHSVMIEEKRGMLKVWNVILIMSTFLMTIFGTFLTRSGVVSSVHAFAQSSIGEFFVGFLAIAATLVVLLIATRWELLRADNRLQSILSRESAFLFNNVLFLGICFAILWGTLFPVIREAIDGNKVTITAPFFNKVTLPLAFALFLLVGIGPLIAWRKASWRNIRRNFVWPFSIGVAAGALLFIVGIRRLVPLAFFATAAFVLTTIFMEFYRGSRARQHIRGEGFLVALAGLAASNKRRYGGFIVHLGIVFVFVGIIGSSFFNYEKEFTLQEGQTQQIKHLTVQFDKFGQRKDVNKEVVYAALSIFQDGKRVALLQPEKHFHFKGEQPQTEVDIYSTYKEDLYVILAGWDQKQVTFKVYLNPIVTWIWYGVGIMVLGTLFLLTPDRRKISAKLQARREEVKHVA